MANNRSVMRGSNGLENDVFLHLGSEDGRGHFQLVFEDGPEKFGVVIATFNGDILNAFRCIGKQVAGVGEPHILKIFAERNAELIGEQRGEVGGVIAQLFAQILQFDIRCKVFVDIIQNFVYRVVMIFGIVACPVNLAQGGNDQLGQVAAHQLPVFHFFLRIFNQHFFKQRQHVAAFVVVNDAGWDDLQVKIIAVDVGNGDQILKALAILERGVNEFRLEQNVDHLEAVPLVCGEFVHLIIVDGKVIAFLHYDGLILKIVNRAPLGYIGKFQKAVAVVGCCADGGLLHGNRFGGVKYSGV